MEQVIGSFGVLLLGVDEGLWGSTIDNLSALT